MRGERIEVYEGRDGFRWRWKAANNEITQHSGEAFASHSGARQAAERARENRTGGEVTEALADYAHEAWSGWMRYLFEKCEQGYDSDNFDALIIPNWAVERWTRQMNTPYAALPEKEKESDRTEAYKILRLARNSPEVPIHEIVVEEEGI